MTGLDAVEAGWDKAARDDAMFNILTDPSGWVPENFFAHGQVEIDQALARLKVDVHKGRALDFGCGIGRLTRALSTYFRRVDGVDVSSEMVRLAREHNDDPQVRYHHNTAPDLNLFKARTFDFVYSMLVLQHMPQEFQRGYVHEFVRVLKPGGVAMIELPDGPDCAHPNSWLSMYGVPRATVEQWLTDGGATVVDVELIPEPSQWQCYRYTAVR